MGTVSVSLPSDGSTADVSDYNTPITTIVNTLNGNIDSNNISSVSGADLVAGTTPGSALDANLAGGWITGQTVPTTVTYNGNRRYTLTYTGTDLTTTKSAGMRNRYTRTVTAPTQCTSLNGSTQYYSKSSPAGMTFTDDFVTGGWYKPSSYATASAVLQSRYNGTSGWQLIYEISGQITLAGYNAGSANTSYVRTYQSIPLNKWTHIAAQLDMSSFTNTATTSYIMIDGVDVPCLVGRAGTNPTALVQAGNLEIGSTNGGTLPFPGKIAQAFITNAKVTQATIRSNFYAQSISPTETSLISAYSFNNSINDLNTTNANNLTANGSVVATTADSPFGLQASGLISSTLDYAVTLSCVVSGGDTTEVVQVPEGCTIPTSGGISAVAYSTQESPYGCPKISSRLSSVIVGVTQTTAGNVDLYGWTTTVYVPTNVNTIRVSISLTGSFAVSNTQGVAYLQDGSTSVKLWYLYTRNGSNAFTDSLIADLPVTSGLHTYKLSYNPTGAQITTLALSTGSINEMSFSVI